MTGELLASIGGVVLSLAFSYVPGVKDWYGRLGGTQKRGVMAVLLVIVAVVVYAASCQGWASWVTCNQAGLSGLIQALVMALMANQATFTITPKGK